MAVYPVPKVKRVKDERYLKKIREYRCCACKGRNADAHHVKSKGAGGDDTQCIPLCRTCHSLLHQLGQTKFEDKFRIKLEKEVKWYQWVIKHEYIPHCN